MTKYRRQGTEILPEHLWSELRGCFWCQEYGEQAPPEEIHWGGGFRTSTLQEVISTNFLSWYAHYFKFRE